LTHYWPINNDIKDYAGNSDMIYGANNTLCPDRFNKSKSALNFENGYNVLTNEINFNGDFAITVWINYNKLTNLSRILEVSNSNNDFVAFYSALDDLACPGLTITNGLEKLTEHKCNKTLATGKWYHLAISICGSVSRLFVNGALDSKREQVLSIFDINGTRNYVGGNSFDGPNLNAKIDELRIYNRCLSQNEIMNLMNV
jgi:hypothetical protein